MFTTSPEISNTPWVHNFILLKLLRITGRNIEVMEEGIVIGGKE